MTLRICSVVVAEYSELCAIEGIDSDEVSFVMVEGQQAIVRVSISQPMVTRLCLILTAV